MAHKLVLVGAGSAQFGLGTLGDILTSKVFEGSEICLHDINPHTMKEVQDQAQAFVENHKLNFTITATTDRKAAFQKAEFIIISIEVGDRFKLWEEDWRIPQQYGINQVYGENGGPGGVFHALRIIPPILEICGDAQAICPSAHLFCYSNPMTAITTTVHRAYPGISFTGMCHEIASLERYLPTMMGIPFDQMNLTAAGLNHFSCLLKAQDAQGKDIYPEIMEKAYGFFDKEIGYSDLWDYYKKTGELTWAEGSTERAKLGIEKSRYPWADRQVFKEIMDRYNLLPITVDSHFGEYLSWAWDVADHRGIVDFFDLYKVMLSRDTKHEISLELHERVVPVMEGIITNSGYIESAVNLPNRGYIQDLPEWIAVEVPGKVTNKGIEGLTMDPLPKGFLALLRNYVGVYDLTAEAIIHKRRDYVIQALLANPVVHQVKHLDALVDRMISQQSKWLGYLK